MPVILAPNDSTHSLTVLILYKVGSRNEPAKIAGISHFLEHMFFKGTKKRPNTLNIAKELDGVGAEYNAYTSREYTGYYVKLHSDHFEKACDVLADMLYNSTFPKEELERERGVILEEYNMYNDNPMMKIEDVYEELVHAGNTLGRDIIGEIATIKSITRKQMVDYKDSFYGNVNGVVVVAGNLPPNGQQILERYFKKKRVRKNIYHTSYKKFTSTQKKPKVSLVHKDTQQVHLGLGFPAYSYTDKRMPALELLSVILGGGMSSRLFTQVRERRGLCYYIGSRINKYQDTGNLYIRAGLDKNKIDNAIKVSISELKRIRDKGVAEHELQDAKEFIKGHLVLAMEDSSSVAEYYARQYLFYNATDDIDKRIEKLMKVTKKQVDAVAKDLIRNEKVNLAMISPFTEEERFHKLLKL